MSQRLSNQTTESTFLTSITQILVASNLAQLLKTLVKINFFNWSYKDHTWWLFDNTKTFFPDESIKLGDAKLLFADVVKQLKAFATVGHFIFPRGNAAQSNRRFNELNFLCARALNNLAIKNPFSVTSLHMTQDLHAKQTDLKLDKLVINIKSNKRPKNLIFMDNDLEQLKLLQMLCCKEKINFLGIHYFKPKGSHQPTRPDFLSYCNMGKAKNSLHVATI